MDPAAIAAAIRAADPVEFWFAAGLIWAGCIASFLWTFRKLHRARLIEDTPTYRVRSAPQGYVELQGQQQLLPGEPIVAPLSGKRSTWWSYRIEEKVTTRTRRGTKTRWRVIDQATSDGIFLLVDDTGRCVVDPEGAEVYPSVTETWYGNSSKPAPGEIPNRSLFGLGRYRYTESRMNQGDPLYAIGFFRTRSGPADQNTGDEVHALLIQWKRDQEGLHRRFDTNRDGVIDQGEWERARTAARDQVLSEQRDAAARPGLHVISDPPDDRNFLLSSRSERELALGYRRRAIAGLILFLASCALGTYLVSSRLGSSEAGQYTVIESRADCQPGHTAHG